MARDSGAEVYLSVDVETAGPIPSEYSLLSLGACVVGRPELHFYAEIRPITKKADPDALAVSGFTLEALEEAGEEPGAAFLRFREWVSEVSGGRRPIFVGFNAAFDWSFVNWYFHHYLGENPFGFSPLDIKAYYMGVAGCQWDETTSSKLPPRFQPAEHEAAHNALADARAQAEIFSKLLSARAGGAKE